MKRLNYKDRELLPLAVRNSLPFPCSSCLWALG